MSLECTTEDCGNNTSTYLCSQCVTDLQAWLDKVPTMRAELFVTMAKLDAVAPRSSGGGGGSTENPAPVNHGAMDVRHALAVWEGQDAQKLALDKFAGGFLPMLQALIGEAERVIDLPTQTIVYGPCQAVTDAGECEHQLKADPEDEIITCPACGAVHRAIAIIASRARRARGNPMPPREAREFLQKEARVFILKKDFENWVQLGKLEPILKTDEAGKERKMYYPGDVLKVFQEMRERRRVKAF
jgi:hypothetical protein